MQKENAGDVSGIDDCGDLTISSTDETSRYPELRKEVTQLLSTFAKAYEDRSFNQMRRLLADDFGGNFAGRKTADGLVGVLRNYRLQAPFFVNVRMTVTVRKIMESREREFVGIVELNTRPKIFSRFFGQPFTTPPLRMMAVKLETGEWRISDLYESDLGQQIDP